MEKKTRKWLFFPFIMYKLSKIYVWNEVRLTLKGNVAFIQFDPGELR